MKEYPPIPQSIGTQFREITNAYVFDKLDGSNLRFEWSVKKGWHKYGTKTRLFDDTDKQFGPAIALFNKTLADQIAEIAKNTKKKWDRLTVFAEYYGPNSFAGQHSDKPQDMKLELIDVAPYKQGILGPADFINYFGHLPSAKYLGIYNWTRGFIERVWENKIPGITFEGVIGKSGNGKAHNLVMAKAKTKAWIDKVKSLHQPEEAEKIIRS